VKSIRSSLLVVHALLVYVLLYGPILVLMALSFNKSRQAAVWTGFSFHWYAVLAHDSDVVHDAWHSLIIALVATVASTVIGTMAALGLSGASREFAARTSRATTSALIYLPIVIPEIVMAVALLTFFSLLFSLIRDATGWRMTLSLYTVMAAHVSFTISYVAIIVRARLSGFDASLEEAAMDLGANRVQTFFRVKLPLIMPAIIAGALLVFTVSIDDYVVTSFVAGTDSTTLPVKIASMVRTGITPEINAVSTVLLICTIILVVIAQKLMTGRNTA
jgi:spermidine/putrescine transport system permease protein